MKRIKLIFFGFLLLLLANQASAKDFLITDYGAKAGADIVNTVAINKAIEACYKNGGGRVVIPSGTYKSGTLLMKDNVELHLEIGARLVASISLKDFPVQPQPSYRSQKDPGGWRALIYANEVTNIAITGSGTIDGNGAQQKPDPNSKFKSDLDGRPRNILFISCKEIRVEGIHMLNSGIWNQHYLNCEDVIVDHVNVYNHSNRNNDGIDIDGCRRFTLSNSIFDTDDDGIVLKSTGPAGCEDIVITNCIVSSFCNAIKAGTESTGGFKNITISNCVVKPSRDQHVISGTAVGIAGLSLEVVDGGVMDGVNMNNIVIEGTQCPIYVRLGNRARKHTADAPEPSFGQMKNIQISNITAYNAGNFSSSITGVPGAKIEDISLNNIRIVNIGGLKSGEYTPSYADVKEDEKGYPQPTVWNNLPSYGFFIRHVKSISMFNISLSSLNPDPRTPVVGVDIDHLVADHLSAMSSERVTNLQLKDVKEHQVSNTSVEILK